MTGETLRELFRSLWRAPAPWLGMLVIGISTDLVDLVLTQGHVLGDLAAIAIIVRFFGVFWLAAVALRRMMDSPASAWVLDSGFAFFYGWQIALLIAEAVAAFLLSMLKNTLDMAITVPVDPYVLTLVFVALSTPIIDLLSLRLVPWVAARTGRVTEFKLHMSRRGMRGHWRAAARTYLLLVLPLFAVHYALTAWIPSAKALPLVRAEWAAADGVVSIAMLMMLLALYVVCYRRARTSA
ncbi:MAG: hypothetical protein ACTHLR_03585 [Rhizomicrobium sp.]